MVCYHHVTYTFQSEFALNSCLNVKEVFARNSHNTWSLSHSNRIRTQNHLVCKQTLNHLAKLAKWLSIVMSTYLYGAFDWMLHFRVNLHSIVSWISRTSECALSRCIIWSFSGSNRIQTHNHLVHKRTLNHLAKSAKFVKFVKFVSYVVSTYGAFDCMLLSCLSTHFRVNLHSVVAWMSRNSIFKKVWYPKIKWQEGDSINISQYFSSNKKRK